MNQMEEIRALVKRQVLSETLRAYESKDKSNKLLGEISSQPDCVMDRTARLNGVPEDQLHIHRAMARGDDNIFLQELNLVNGLLKTGDIILMTGTSSGSKALVEMQKKSYPKARSSHVALVHADFLCVDAMPKIGVSSRVISEILRDVEPSWRVMRCKKIAVKNLSDTVTSACVFYLAQPYKILPSKKDKQKNTYCSELARKVYNISGVDCVGIPNNLIIKPADFDRLLDANHPEWLDVTEAVRPAIVFCSKYDALIKMFCALAIEGLKLNRHRFEERKEMVVKIQKAAKTGIISREDAFKEIKKIRDIENNLNNHFWDFSKSIKK